MSDKPLSVAVAVLVRAEKILLIKRIRGDYVGCWAMPGGKIEKDEHVSSAAVREILEEAGIKAEFKSHLGLVSEHLRENGQVLQHFLLHLCALTSESDQILNSQEGALAWFHLSELARMKEQIIPSDYLIIEKFVLHPGKNYYECVVEKEGEKYSLKKFA